MSAGMEPAGLQVTLREEDFLSSCRPMLREEQADLSPSKKNYVPKSK